MESKAKTVVISESDVHGDLVMTLSFTIIWEDIVDSVVPIQYDFNIHRSGCGKLLFHEDKLFVDFPFVAECKTRILAAVTSAFQCVDIKDLVFKPLSARMLNYGLTRMLQMAIDGELDWQKLGFAGRIIDRMAILPIEHSPTEPIERIKNGARMNGYDNRPFWDEVVAIMQGARDSGSARH